MKINKNILQDLKNVFSPNKLIHKKTFSIMIAIQIIVLFVVWYNSPTPFLPKPGEILSAFGILVSRGLIGELWVSTSLCLESMLVAILLSMVLAYLTVMPFFRPISHLITKFRFLTLVGLSLFFMLLTSSGHSLKVSLMTFGVTVFFLTSMVSIVKAVDKTELFHARTLGMSEWRVVWEVIVLGKIDQVFEAIRQNFAMAWMMLTLVEGIVAYEGGIGKMLLNQNKYLNLPAVFCIQFVILFMGMAQDYLIGVLKNLFCPYANLTMEKE